MQLGGWTSLDGRAAWAVTLREPTAVPLPRGARKGTARLSGLRGWPGGGRLARRTAWGTLVGGPKRKPGGGIRVNCERTRGGLIGDRGSGGPRLTPLHAVTATATTNRKGTGAHVDPTWQVLGRVHACGLPGGRGGEPGRQTRPSALRKSNLMAKSPFLFLALMGMDASTYSTWDYHIILQLLLYDESMKPMVAGLQLQQQACKWRGTS